MGFRNKTDYEQMDASEIFKRQSMLTAKRRKRASNILFTLLCVYAAAVTAMCIYAYFFDEV